LFLERIARDKEPVSTVCHYLGIGSDRAGQYDAASAHGFDDRHPEGFLATLEIDTEAAALNVSSQMTLSNDPVECNPHLGLGIFPYFSPYPSTSINMQVEALVGYAQGPGNSQGCLQALGGMASIQEGKRVAYWRPTTAASEIRFHHSPVANKDFVSGNSPLGDRLATDKIAG
jgi:hypothetical protein